MSKNIFNSFILNRIIKCNYSDPPWIIGVLKIRLKEQSYLTKTYYKYGKRKSNFEKLIVKTNECVEIISAAKDKYVIQVCEKLNDPIAAPKTCSKIKNRFLSNKKMPYHFYWLMGKQSQTFLKKHLILISFWRLNVLQYKIQAVYLPFI